MTSSPEINNILIFNISRKSFQHRISFHSPAFTIRPHSTSKNNSHRNIPLALSDRLCLFESFAPHFSTISYLWDLIFDLWSLISPGRGCGCRAVRRWARRLPCSSHSTRSGCKSRLESSFECIRVEITAIMCIVFEKDNRSALGSNNSERLVVFKCCDDTEVNAS